MTEKLFAADWFPFHATTPTPAQIAATFERYATAITAGDFDAITACFVPEGVMEDPVGSPPIKGHGAIRAFFENGQKMAGGSFKFSLQSAIRIAGNEAAATTLTVTPNFRVESVGVLRFDAQGLIVHLKAYYGATNVFPAA